LIYNVAVKAGLSDTEAQEWCELIAVAKKISEFKADPGGVRQRLADAHERVGELLISFGNGRRRLSAIRRAIRPSRRGHRIDDAINRVPDPAGARLEECGMKNGKELVAALERSNFRSAPGNTKCSICTCYRICRRDTARTLQASCASVYMAKQRVSRRLKKEITKLKQKMFCGLLMVFVVVGPV